MGINSICHRLRKGDGWLQRAEGGSRRPSGAGSRLSVIDNKSPASTRLPRGTSNLAHAFNATIRGWEALQRGKKPKHMCYFQSGSSTYMCPWHTNITLILWQERVSDLSLSRFTCCGYVSFVSNFNFSSLTLFTFHCPGELRKSHSGPGIVSCFQSCHKQRTLCCERWRHGNSGGYLSFWPGLS